MIEGEPALELRSVRKRFGTTVALDGASLTVSAGSLHILLGENGAGKTTLLTIAAGLQQPDAGDVLVDGRVVHWKSRGDAIDAGLSAVHQHLSLVPSMTIAENVALGERRMTRWFSPDGMARRVRRIAEEAGLDVDPFSVVGKLSVAAQQRAEIVKAIAHDPQVLVLDEPTAALAPRDAADLFRWLRTFVASGRTAIVITHRLREAMQYGDAITVLRSGRTVLEAATVSVSEGEVLAAILGAPDKATEQRPSNATAGPGGSLPARIVLSGISVVDAAGIARLRGVHLVANAGEILGVCGVDGAGQHELLRVIAGRLRPSSGTVTLAKTIGFVPEDRLRDALVGELPLMENFAVRGAGRRRGVMPWGALATATASAIDEFDVRGASPATSASALSGGNQQKFVLARELDDAPVVVVADNPARGLDVRASQAVYTRLRVARDDGAAVIVYSSDIEEVLSLADRVVVCHAGTVREVPAEPSAIGAAMVGAG